MANTIISNGVITTDTLKVSANTTTGTLSVSGNASVAGRLSINGADIIETIAEQEAKIDNHIDDMGSYGSPHMTVAEHEKFNKIAQLFADMEPDNSYLGYSSIDIPEAAVPLNYFPELYAAEAQATWRLILPQGNVYGSRVPLAYETYPGSGSFENTYSSIAEAVGLLDPLYVDTDGNILVADKLWDNAGLQHTCSTDTVENQDDYTGMGEDLDGRKRLFYWEYGNYVKDQYGIKHVTAINGVPAGETINKNADETFLTVDFDKTKNTCVFGPTFWFACVEDKKEDMMLEINGEKKAVTQLWIISDSPWETIDATHELFDGIVYPGLSEGNKTELGLHGIGEKDWHIWPECLVKDANGNDKIRPYWCHSAFALGAKPDTSGLWSVAQLPLVNNTGFKALNEMAVDENGVTYAASNCPGSATVNGFGMLFDIIKNSTKNSQSIHSGYVSAPPTALSATADYDNTDGRHDSLDYYLFPADYPPELQPGMSIRLSTSPLTIGDVDYNVTNTLQHARVKNVGTYNLATGEPADSGTKCIAVDKATGTANPLQPFRVYKPANLPSPLPENTPVCCYASPSLSMAGETMLGGKDGRGVLYKHDGAVHSYLQSADGYVGTHTYRVQGTEYSPGANICAADTVAIRGNGSTTVNINGETYTPTNKQYAILQCNVGESREVAAQNNVISNWTANGQYDVVAISTANRGTIYNSALSYTGVAYPTLTSGGGDTATSEGTQDFFATQPTVYLSEFLAGGNWISRTAAGSSCLYMSGNIGVQLPTISARD